MTSVVRDHAALYRIDPKHPVINTLGKTFGGYLNSKIIKGSKAKTKQPGNVVKGFPGRVDIVDEKLCEDVIQYLAPTLEQYKGCTLIDINPGACVWSQKLHDFLRPKRHLLMEPDDRYTKPFLQPLLEKSGSRYMHYAYPGIHPRAPYRIFEQFIKDEHLAFEPFLPQDEPERRQLNTDILVTGNLVRRAVDFLNPTRSAPQFSITLQQMAWTALVNHLYHRNGPVRQLWWFPDSQKYTALPRRPLQRSGYNIGLQLAANINEVAGTQLSTASARSRLSQPNETNLQTPLAFAHESAKIVQERMRAAGIKVPRGREVLRSVTSVPKSGTVKARSPVSIRHKDFKDFVEEVAHVKEAVADIIGVLVKKTKKSTTPEVPDTFYKTHLEAIEYPQCLAIAKDFTFGGRSAGRGTKAVKKGRLSPPRQRIAVFLDLQLRIINLEAHVKHFEDLQEDVREITMQVINLDKEFRKMIDQVSATGLMTEYLDVLIHDQLAFYATPQQLPFDCRQYEPLKANVDDFWPRYELCLLDVTPACRDVSVPGVATPHDFDSVARSLLDSLLNFKAGGLVSSLNKIAINAGNDLVPLAPSVSDARKGGRLNAEQLKVRNLSAEMVVELTKAWFEWPFRPEQSELVLATAGGGGSPAADSDFMEDEVVSAAVAE